MLDLDLITDGLFKAFELRLEKATAPLLARIAELEKRPTAEVVEAAIAHAVRAAVEALPAPAAGQDADMEVVKAWVDAAAPPSLDDIVSTVLLALPAPVAGKDADAELVKALVAEAVAALPPAQPGQDADPELVKTLVAEAVAALPAPENGKDADPELVKALVAEAVAALPPAQPGQDADPEVVKALVAEAVAALPAPENGKDADPETIKAMVAEAVAAIPAAKDGVGLAGALIDREGDLVVTLTDGTHRALGRVVGKDGDPGKPGANGFQLSDFDTEIRDGGRTLLLKFAQGDVLETHELSLDVMIYRGVYQEGGDYARGDTVTFGGSLWHCDEPTSAKPGEGDKAWTLAAKRGRDGKSAEAGPRPPTGPITLGSPSQGNGA